MPDAADILTRTADIETRAIPNGAMLIDLKTGQCFRLNHVGSQIWAMLQKPHAVREIVEQVAKHYEAPLDQVERDVSGLLQYLWQEKLVRLAGQTTAP